MIYLQESLLPLHIGNRRNMSNERSNIWDQVGKPLFLYDNSSVHATENSIVLKNLLLDLIGMLLSLYDILKITCLITLPNEVNNITFSVSYYCLIRNHITA